MLSDNAPQLAANGVLYPTYGATSGARSVNHQRLAWNIHDKKIEHEILKGWAASLVQTEASMIVLSAEDFCRLRNLSFLEIFLDLFEVEVVFYVRRQDEWLNSWYNLNIKWPFHARMCRSDPIEFLDYLDEFHWIRYFDTADRWAERLGRERVHIRVMERGQIEDPVADFCELAHIELGLDSKSAQIELPERQLNASLPADQLEILRRLGIFQYSEAVRTKVTNAVRKIDSPVSTNVYQREIRQLIIDQYALQNQNLAKSYLGRSDGVLFRDLEFPEDPAAREGSTDERVLYLFIRGIISEFARDIGDN